MNQIKTWFKTIEITILKANAWIDKHPFSAKINSYGSKLASSRVDRYD